MEVMFPFVLVFQEVPTPEVPPQMVQEEEELLM
jgi:hypothetical protein